MRFFRGLWFRCGGCLGWDVARGVVAIANSLSVCMLFSSDLAAISIFFLGFVLFCFVSFCLSIYSLVHPIYLPYFPNSSSALNRPISSSRKQIATAISPSGLLGIRYIRLSTGANRGRNTASGLPSPRAKSSEWQ